MQDEADTGDIAVGSKEVGLGFLAFLWNPKC